MNSSEVIPTFFLYCTPFLGLATFAAKQIRKAPTATGTYEQIFNNQLHAEMYLVANVALACISALAICFGAPLLLPCSSITYSTINILIALAVGTAASDKIYELSRSQ
ncbi:MAG: hypothetical protein COT85_05590 [Chlamydiae bacterium CG10_big_fil_rev_8_21_14_0_10_42_34]|nr:MAG: hypothetical protein COT85_05590 [Chlamydiae bacterium CG10_big_fil_rev_8_21_14_0_10_42_34]